MDQFRRCVSSLHSSVELLWRDFGYRALVAGELEFYLPDAPERYADIDAHPFWRELQTSLLPIAKCEAERGHNQYEVALLPQPPQLAAQSLMQLKEALTRAALTHAIAVDFSAKPLVDQPGSGLHVHVHLENGDGQRVYYKDDERMSDALRFSIGGLLANIQQDLPIFAPTAASRQRFVTGSNAPLTVSWGANNRSCAIRLPDKPPTQKHIEHRVSGADAEPMAVIAAILRAIHHGLQARIDPGPQQYGDANLPRYSLPPITQS